MMMTIKTNERAAKTVVTAELKGAAGAEMMGILHIIQGLNSIVLSHFTVVGSYARWDGRTREGLKTVRSQIVTGLRPSKTRANHLIWAPPGSGKTYFVEQIASGSQVPVTYRSLNLAALNEREFKRDLDVVVKTAGPTLCLIDEVQAKSNSAWPFELLVKTLDDALERQDRLVFVLAGSGNNCPSLKEFKQEIASRRMGRDLLSRIEPNFWEIPPMDDGDRLIIAITQMLNAAAEIGHVLKAVEKLALFYIATSPRLTKARQLHELVFKAVERFARDDDRIKYDDLFVSGDFERYHFWEEMMPEVKALANSFVLLDSSHHPSPPSRGESSVTQLNEPGVYALRIGKYARGRIRAETGLDIDDAELDADDMSFDDLNKKLTHRGVDAGNASRLAAAIRESYFTEKYFDYDDKDDVRSVISDWHRDLDEIIRFTHFQLNGARVVYAGIGNGRDLGLVCPTSRLVAGVDVSAKMLERAARRAPQSLQFIPYHTSAEEMTGVPSDAFDVYLALRLYQSALFDPRAAAWSAHRVLRTGGLAIISISDAYLDKTGGTGRVVRGMLAADRLDHLRPYRKAIQVLNLLRNAGFHESGLIRKRADIYIWATKGST
jgi:SAM-dependent methyltransferase